MRHILDEFRLSRDDCLSIPRKVQPEPVVSKRGRPHCRVVCSAGGWSMTFDSVKDAVDRRFNQRCIYQAIRRGYRHCGRRWKYEDSL